MPMKMENRPDNQATPGLLWWLRQIVFTGIAAFFTAFGTCQLYNAYRLGDPFSFIMSFFGSSLMIMISVVMVLGFIIRMRQAMRPGQQRDISDPSD